MSRPKLQFSEGDLQRVREFIDQTLANDGRVFRKEVFDGISGQLEIEFNEVSFTHLLGETIKAGVLPYRMVKGKFGGILPASSKPEPGEELEDPPPADDISSLIDQVSQQLPSAPKPPEGWTYARKVWIDKKLFLVHRPYTEMHRFLTNVLLGSAKEGGPIVFNGIAYTCEHPNVMARFLTEWLRALPSGESEPVLQGDSDVPVDLR